MASTVIRSRTGQDTTVNAQITTVMKHLQDAKATEGGSTEYPGGFARWDTESGSFAIRLQDVESLTGVK